MKIIGLAGWSGAGKTTLVAKLLPLLIARGLSVSTIKHAHHAFDVDTPGKDSYIHRQAGAREVLVASATRFALMAEHRGTPEPELPALLARLAPVDLVVVEGFKRHPHPKIEVFRAALGKPMLWPEDATIVAVASDQPVPLCDRAVIGLDDVAAIADCIVARAMSCVLQTSGHRAPGGT